MLGLWSQHYGRLVGNENLYILDHSSTDGSTSVCGGSVIRLPRDVFDDHARAAAISEMQRALLKFYDVVIYTDTDEFFVVDPERHESFSAFLTTLDAPITAGIGLDIVHRPKAEAPIDFSRSILSQREYAMFRGSQSKPAIVTEPTEWAAGFHTVQSQPRFRSDIIMFHLRGIDLQRSLQRLAMTRSMEWSQRALEINMGSHQRLDDETYAAWFHHNREQAIEKGDVALFTPEEWIDWMKSAFFVEKGFICYYRDKSGNEVKSMPFKIPERFRHLL